ncbi:MAG: 23S rRNA (guanosine(2251)-2'-O)-methyltransferase RlmB [Syntrophales bacterium]|nr:23S rRNA (guanosine(2251)-2'-O)-methyltransferase RlmB [Syntrophales bacterium]MDD5641020.1 23S rRNA (guanosine(2251)-2'-O)-methyltransferase RlmB [Syntrophales bacterium]
MTQIIYGRHPVLAALRQGDSALEEVVIARGTKGHWLGEVRRLARAQGVRLRELDRPALDRLAGTGHHQGILARRATFIYRSETELLDLVAGLAEPALLVAADGLTDPMNLGNLCRSAYAAGAHGLIIPKDRAAGVTPAVLKAAAGALEFLPLFRVTNLADCLIHLQEAGLMIIGTDSQAEKSIYDVDLTGPLVLVIGSEDKGLRPRVRQQCNLLLSIPMARQEVGSLNAAAAGAVVLFEIRRQRLR